MISPNQLGMIQVAKSQLVKADMLTDSEYRSELKRRFNVDSSTDLSSRQASAFIEWFKSKGFKPQRKASKKLPADVIALPTPMQTELIDILRANYHWKYENGFDLWLQKRMGMDRIKTRAEATKVIEGLKSMIGIGREIIQMRALPFPLNLDEDFFITEHGEILPYRWQYDLQAKKLIMLINEDYG